MTIRFTGPARAPPRHTDDAGPLNKEALEAQALTTYNQALTLQGRSSFKEAVEKHHIVLELTQDQTSQFSSRLRYLAHKNLGSLYKDSADLEAAKTHCMCALKIDDSSPVAWYELAMMLVASKELVSAQWALKEVLQRRPDHILAYERLVELMYVLGDVQGCEQVGCWLIQYEC